MTLGVIATVLSALFLTLMVIADRLMIGDCFDDKPVDAWIVSSVAGTLLGLGATALAWVLVSIFSEITISSLLNVLYQLAVPYGLLILSAGVLSILTLKYYFQCFSVGGESTAIAGWLAATPIFVLTIVSVIWQLQVNFAFLDSVYLESINTSVDFVVLSIIATLALIAFEIFTNSSDSVEKRGNYVLPLALMVIFNATYAVIIHISISNAIQFINAPDYTILLGVLPYYWLGFTIGMIPLLSASVRSTFQDSWNVRIYRYLPAVLATEVIGMLVFFTEFFGLGTLDPTFVSVIIGSHIVAVYATMKYLSLVRNRLEAANHGQLSIFGMSISTHRLPVYRFSLLYLLGETFILLTITAAIYNLTIVALL